MKIHRILKQTTPLRSPESTVVYMKNPHDY